jgi:ribosomal protein L37AE/L43A
MARIREGRWLCRSCGRENAGRDVSCVAGCGVARPANVRFYLPENSPIITDPALLATAQEKPNWNCDHCGGANPGSVAGAKVVSCGHCGQARDAADTTYQTRDYALSQVPRTDAEANPRRASRRTTAPRKPRKASGALRPILKILAVCFAIALLAASFFVPSSFSTAEVVDLSWKREIVIEELKTLKKQGWSLPSDADLLSTESRVRKTIDVVVGHVPDTRTEMRTVTVGQTSYVCGSRDMGNGFFQDIKCTKDITERRSVEVPYNRPITKKKDIIETWYTYHVDRWVPVDTAVASGGAHSDPDWPQVTSTPTRRAGRSSEGYFVTLQMEDGETKTTSVSTDIYFDRDLGDEIFIARNIWGHILDTKPASDM